MHRGEKPSVLNALQLFMSQPKLSAHKGENLLAVLNAL